MLNNVETWANIHMIIDKGADWFTSVGTDSSKGTKIFSLVENHQHQSGGSAHGHDITGKSSMI